jgi:L-fuconolactonase
MEEQPPIIDTHQHLWDLGELTLSWASSVPTLNKTFSPTDYAEATAGLGVVTTVYAEVEADAECKAKEVELISRLCDDPAVPTAAIIGSADPSVPLPAWVSQNAHVRAIRWGIHFQPAGTCLKPEFIAGVKALGEMGKAFEVCIRPAELADAATLAAAVPGTTIVIDHCGNADPSVVAGDDPGQPPVPQPQTEDSTYHTWHTKDGWEAAMRAIAALPNTVCKLSGIMSRLKPASSPADSLGPTINFCMDVFGEDRCMFGGDWPLVTLGADGTTTYALWVKTLQAVLSARSVTPETQHKIFSLNAKRVYGLE